MVKVSIVGCGHLGSALIEGLTRADGHEIVAYDHTPEPFSTLPPSVETTTDPADAAAAPVVILAVKPGDVVDAVSTLALDADQTLLSAAAGVPTETIAAHTDATVVRFMPNLAAATNTMAAAVSGEVSADVGTILDDLGEFVEIDEQQMHTATALNGSGPAFVFYVIQALADAGTDAGLAPTAARTLAAQTVKGAAETVLRSEESLDELIDAVCSPNGTTIEGMDVLWESDVDETLASALLAAEERSRELAGDHA